MLPELLYSEVVEAQERMSAQGEVIEHLNVNELRRQLQAQFDAGIRSVAIVFMHA